MEEPIVEVVKYRGTEPTWYCDEDGNKYESLGEAVRGCVEYADTEPMRGDMFTVFGYALASIGEEATNELAKDLVEIVLEQWDEEYTDPDRDDITAPTDGMRKASEAFLEAMAREYRVSAYVCVYKVVVDACAAVAKYGAKDEANEQDVGRGGDTGQSL